MRLVKVLPIASPAAGNDFTITVPGGALWEVLGFQGVFTTSAAVASRQARLQYANGDGALFFATAAATTIPASQANRMSWAQGLGTFGTTAASNAPLPTPPIPLPVGFRINSFTANIDVADQWSGLILIVREWSETDVLQELVMISQQLTSQVMPEIIS
jgi:hypothetical protein